jgi:hypothetical protein
VRDPYGVDALEGLEDLSDERAGLDLGEAAAIDDRLEEIAIGAEFHNDIVIHFIAQEVEEENDARVLGLLVSADLDFKSFVQILTVETISGNDFAREIFFGLDLLDQLDNSKRAFTNDAAKNIGANLRGCHNVQTADLFEITHGIEVAFPRLTDQPGKS